MKILFVSKDDIGGIGLVCTDMMRTLKASGHEESFLTREDCPTVLQSVS